MDVPDPVITPESTALRRRLLDAVDDLVGEVVDAASAATADPARTTGLADCLAVLRSAEHDALHPSLRACLAEGDRVVEQLIGQQERLAAFAAELPHADAAHRRQLGERLLEVLTAHRAVLASEVLPDLLEVTSPTEQREILRRLDRDRSR